MQPSCIERNRLQLQKLISGHNVQDKEPAPCTDWHIVYAGKTLFNGKTLEGYGVQQDSTLHLVGRLLGGKGGFGSLLRGAGRAILTDNVDACRDLSGRRLRQANAEKRLAEWAAEARERELEKIALKHVKEQRKATQKEERAQVTSHRIPSKLVCWQPVSI